MKKFQIALPAALRPENGAVKCGDDSAGFFFSRGHKFVVDGAKTDPEDFVAYLRTDFCSVAGVFDGHGGSTCPRAFAGLLVPRIATSHQGLAQSEAGMPCNSFHPRFGRCRQYQNPVPLIPALTRHLS